MEIRSNNIYAISEGVGPFVASFYSFSLTYSELTAIWLDILYNYNLL